MAVMEVKKFWGSKGVIDFSWRPCVLYKSCDTQKSMDYKQKNKKIGDLHFVYVNIKSRVES